MISRLIRTRNNERGAALLLALLITVVLLGLITALTVVSLGSLNRSTADTAAAGNSAAANLAIANAAQYANNYTNSGDKNSNLLYFVDGTERTSKVFSNSGSTNPTGVVADTYAWRWDMYPVASQKYPGMRAYDVYAVGYRNNTDEPRAVYKKVRLEPIVAANTTYTSTGITYKVDQNFAAASLGVYGSSSVKLGNNAYVYSYDSKVSPLPTSSTATTGNGVVGSGGTVSIPYQYQADKINLYNMSPTTKLSDRCIVGPCSYPDRVSLTKFGIDLSNFSLLNSFSPSISCPATPVDWVASANGGKLTANGCYKNIVFDQNTSVTVPNGLKSVTIIAQGDITVQAGVSVNTASSTGASSLMIRAAKTSTVQLTSAAAAAAPTRFVGYIGGAAATCNIGTPGVSNSSTANALYVGSLACNTVAVGDGNKIFTDDQAGTLAGGPVSGQAQNTSGFLWLPSSIESMTAKQFKAGPYGT